MIGIYDVSGDTKKGANLLAGDEIRGNLSSEMNLVNTAHQTSLSVQVHGNDIFYIARFKCKIAEVSGNRSNTCLAVHRGNPQSAREFRDRTLELLKSQVKIESDPSGFLPYFSQKNNPEIISEVKQIDSKIRDDKMAQLKTGNIETAALISGTFLTSEMKKRNFIPVEVRELNSHSKVDDFQILEKKTGGRGLHIVIDRYGETDGVQWREKSFRDKIMDYL